MRLYRRYKIVRLWKGSSLYVLYRPGFWKSWQAVDCVNTRSEAFGAINKHERFLELTKIRQRSRIERR